MTNITQAQRALLERAAAEPLTDTAGLNPNTAYTLIKRKLVMWLPLEGGGSRLLVTEAGLAVLAVAKKRAAGRGDVATAEPAEQGQTSLPEESVSGASQVTDKAVEDPAEDATGVAAVPTEVEPAGADLGAADQPDAAVDANVQEPAAAAPVARKPKKDVPTGKLGILVDLLKRPEGATLAAMSGATGWQTHSVRGAMSGSLKKKFGLTIVGAKTDGTRVYRITSGDAA